MKFSTLVLMTLALAPLCHAQTLYTWPSGKGGALAGGGFNMLSINKFTTGNTAVNVIALGYEINDTTGVGQVGLFDSDRRLLTWANVNLATTPESGYHWANISSFTLRSNTTYFLAGFVGVGNRYLYNTNTASLPTGFVDQGTFYSGQLWGGTIQNLENSGSFRHYIGNVKTQPVPEPAALAAIALGLLGLSRRKMRTTA